MNEFDIYEHPTLGRQIVKKGFCRPACIFNFWWAFFKGMWAHGVALIAIGFALPVAVGFASFYLRMNPKQELVITLAGVIVFAWIVGDEAYKWRTKNLKQRGFRLVKTVKAETKDAVIAQLAQSDSD